jgi:hypothetical protein
MIKEDDCIIYDFETLGQNPLKSAVVCLAALAFSEERFISDKPYSFSELVQSAKLIKFDAQEQVNIYGRTIDKSTLDWWSKQSPEARKILVPSHLDKPLEQIYSFLLSLSSIKPEKIKKVYTRGNTFDPVILDSLLNDIGKSNPFPWWAIRDTRSMIEGMTYGSDIKNNFIPEGLETAFIAHNAIHDIVIDVMRIQFLARLLFL